MTTADPISPALRRLAMIAILLSTLTGTIDASIVNVALPTLATDLQATPSQTVWVTTAFLLAVACAVPATSALGDQVGRRRLFLVGVPIFTLSSLGCALAPTLGTLITLRVLQGVGSAVVLAAAIPLIRSLFPSHQLGQALGFNAMTVALGTSAGPALGGLILVALPWPWLFLINVPIGAVSFALAWAALPPSRPEAGHYDWQGALFAAGSIGCLLLGVRELANIDTLRRAAALLLMCGLFAALFIRREHRARRPAIPLGLFTPRFSLTVGAAWASFVAQGIAFVALPFLLQGSLGETPLQSALLITPWPLIIVFAAPVSGRFADRISPARLALVGLVVITGGLAMLALLGSAPSTWLVLVATGICGLGFGIFQSPNNRDMMTAAPAQYAASAAAVLNTNRSVGQSAGSAVVSIALVATGAAAGTMSRQAHAASEVLWAAVAAAAGAAALCAIKLRSTSVSDCSLRS